MTMQVWQQEEWHGMARRGVEKKDPYTSKLEVNTQPGVDRLRKITARKTYLSSRLPCLAAKFDSVNSFYDLWCSSAGSATQVLCDLDKTDAAGVVCFCVKDYALLDTSFEYPLLSVGYGPNTTGSVAFGLYLHFDTDSWYVGFHRWDGTIRVAMGTVALVSGSWYWALGVIDSVGEKLSITYYKDGSGTPTETVDSSSYANTSLPGDSPYPVTLGGGAYADPSLLGGAISFAALSSAGNYPTPWEVQFARSGGDYDFVFYPFNPSVGKHPALIGDTTDYYHWRPNPRYDADVVEDDVKSTLDGIGLRSNNGKSYLVNISGTELFGSRTVFLFDCDTTNIQGTQVLLRSSDSTFMISIDDSNDLSVRWAPANPAAGSAELGGLAEAFYDTGWGDSVWLAVEVDPINQDGEENIRLYAFAAGTWTEKTVTSGTVIGNGVLRNASTELVFCEASCVGNFRAGGLSVYDFRMISGDDAWATNHTTATMATSVPSGLDLWLQHDETARWPLIANVKTLNQAHSNEQTSFPIALSNRVNGRYDFKVNPYSADVAWDGCPYITNGMLASVKDIRSSADGTISGTTDAYYFEDIVSYAQKALRSTGKPAIGAVGNHSYIIGTAPLQYVSDKGNVVGWGPAEVDCHYYGTAAASATLDYKGDLDWSGDYRVLLTHYNPTTGDESNPYGPYRFTADVAPSTTAPAYGALGCALKLEAFVWTPQDLSKQEMRFYRYHAGDGTYYLEGRSALGTTTYDSTRKRYYRAATFTLSMSDDDLSLQKEIEYDNDSPPLHLFTTIWAGRAFYVDAVVPSRVYFSKQYQLGSVPRVNILWTDEGVGGDILGFLPGMGGLLVLRERSIWIIPEFATDDAAFIQALIPDIGCVSGAAAIFAEGILWWASPGGIYSFDGQQVMNHSERLRGIDRNVFKSAHEQTAVYYDRTNWKAVFTCSGSGISFDVRTGAASLVSAPESCATEVNTPAYSGPVFGADGMVWCEQKNANDSLSLTSAGDGCSYPIRQVTNPGSLYCHWIDGATTSSVLCGFTHTSVLAASAWVHTTGHVGRTMTQSNTAYDSFWTKTIHAVSSPTAALVRTNQTAKTYLWVDSFPMYFRSQELFLGRMADGRIYERIDFVTDSEVTDSARATYTFNTLVPSGAATMSATATTVWTYKQNEFQLPIRLRGNQAYYTVYCDNNNSMPEIVSVGIHFRVSPPRGRTI